MFPLKREISSLLYFLFTIPLAQREQPVKSNLSCWLQLPSAQAPFLPPIVSHSVFCNTQLFFFLINYNQSYTNFIFRFCDYLVTFTQINPSHWRAAAQPPISTDVRKISRTFIPFYFDVSQWVQEMPGQPRQSTQTNSMNMTVFNFASQLFHLYSG